MVPLVIVVRPDPMQQQRAPGYTDVDTLLTLVTFEQRREVDVEQEALETGSDSSGTALEGPGDAANLLGATRRVLPSPPSSPSSFANSQPRAQVRESELHLRAIIYGTYIS